MVMGTAYPTFLETSFFMKVHDLSAVTMFNNFHQFCRKDVTYVELVLKDIFYLTILHLLNFPYVMCTQQLL